MLPYEEFLRAKFALAPQAGLPCTPEEVSPLLKPHQRMATAWAVSGGRRALFASWGLGKTLCQLEFCRLLHAREGGKYLIVCPLGVRAEFQHDSHMLGMDWQFIRRTEEMASGQNFYLTNYESIRDGKLDPALFIGVSLDEASVLRSFGSLTTQAFVRLFPTVRYRLTATATPAPNRYLEILRYAHFLGVMDQGQALTRFFQRDSTKAGNLTLYPSQEKSFFTWLSSWSLWLQSPADLCTCDCHKEGYHD
jgi:SNF2 family DNA or RNA helicase